MTTYHFVKVAALVYRPMRNVVCVWNSGYALFRPRSLRYRMLRQSTPNPVLTSTVSDSGFAHTGGALMRVHSWTSILDDTGVTGPWSSPETKAVSVRRQPVNVVSHVPSNADGQLSAKFNKQTRRCENRQLETPRSGRHMHPGVERRESWRHLFLVDTHIAPEMKQYHVRRILLKRYMCVSWSKA